MTRIYPVLMSPNEITDTFKSKVLNDFELILNRVISIDNLKFDISKRVIAVTYFEPVVIDKPVKKESK